MRVDHRRALDGPDITALIIQGNRCGWTADFKSNVAEQHARSGHINGQLLWENSARLHRRFER